MVNTPPASQQNSRTSTTLSQQPTLVTSTPPGQQTQSNNVPSTAFRSALDEFQKRLTKDELIRFQTTTYPQFCDELHVLQEEQIKRRGVMNLSRIAGFLEGMHQLGKTIEVFVNASNMVAFIWGPIKFLLLTGSEYVDSFETLLDAYELIGEQLPLLVERETLFGSNTPMQKALESIYIDILKFHRQALRFFQGNRIKTMIKSMWKSFDTEFKGILASLHRHKDLVEQLTSVVHYSDSAAHYRQYQTDMEGLRDRLGKQLEEEKEKKMVTVVTWLSVSNQAEDDHMVYQNIRSNFSTTATWIFRHEYIKDWINSTVPESSLLWMHGIPGAGKTILASAIIDKCRQKQDFTTAFYYCHDGDSNSNSAVAILKGLANMLLDHGQDKDLLLSLFYTKRVSGGDATLRSINKATSLLEQCCAIVPKLFFVVDGLDECDPNERREVLSALTKLVNEFNIAEPGSLRVLIVSQHFQDIQRGLEGSGTARLAPRIIRLTEKEVSSDIVTYIRALVEDIATRNSSADEPFNENIKEYLRNLTMVNAKGMFLYAKLVLNNLLALPTRLEVTNAIQHERFPQGLKDAYNRIIERIKEHSKDADWMMARKLLGWMICAKRQLTWKEIQVALSIDTKEQTIDYEDRHLRKNIQDICGSLVVMCRDRVTLVHSTAKTHIRENTKDIHEPTVECELAVLCLQYLTFPCFRIDPDEGSREPRQHMLAGRFAFQDYAIAAWFHHVNAFVHKGDQFLRDADDKERHLNDLWEALEEFTSFHQEDWYGGIVQSCSEACGMFRPYILFELLVQMKSHIYTFQQKGFDARHKISIQGLEAALERNRKLLEEPPKDMNAGEKALYSKFYDDKRLYKCTKITCRYFSQGFSDKKARKRHVNIHDRPFQCEVMDCLGQEGFANDKDLRNHKRSFHPDMCDLAESFKSSIAKRANAGHACGYCGKTFTRKFHREDHEKSNRGERPHVCSECGKAFTRRNDCERHKKLHERGR